jgi:hypothetical protein
MEGMMEPLIAIISVICVFIGLPGIVFSFIHHHQKNKLEIKKMEYNQKTLELEIEKQNNQIKILEEENKKYDKIINQE